MIPPQIRKGLLLLPKFPGRQGRARNLGGGGAVAAGPLPPSLSLLLRCPHIGTSIRNPNPHPPTLPPTLESPYAPSSVKATAKEEQGE